MKDELDFFFTTSVINYIFPCKISEILEKYIREPWITPGDGFPEISKCLKERSYRFAGQKSKARAKGQSYRRTKFHDERDIRRPNFPMARMKEPIRQEKKEEVDQSGNGKVVHSGVSWKSNRYLKVSEIFMNVW